MLLGWIGALWNMVDDSSGHLMGVIVKDTLQKSDLDRILVEKVFSYTLV